MKGSFSLGKIFGISIKVHFTFLLVFIYLAYVGYKENFDLAEFLMNTLSVLGLFVCVLMHEYGHALVARRYGITTHQILILPIGGVAQLERMPEKPKQELWVALAGPLVNVIILCVLVPLIYFIYGFRWLGDTQQLKIYMSIPLIFLAAANVTLVLFNLIPAFPMDGGRVFRALLAMKLSYPKATTIAARVGQVLSLGFIVSAPFQGNYLIILIGVFLIIQAESELRMVNRRYKLQKLNLSDLLNREVEILLGSQSISEAIARHPDALHTDYIVKNEEGAICGILTREMIKSASEMMGTETMVGAMMTTNIALISEDKSIEEVLGIMSLYELEMLPVLSLSGEFMGTISRKDITMAMRSRKAVKASMPAINVINSSEARSAPFRS